MEIEIRVGSEFLIQFKRLSKKYRSLKSDIKDLKDSLVIDPYQGTSLGKGVRKVRMAIASKGKGKSGGARVITYNLYQEGDSIIIDLLTIYDKGEISNISDEFISFLLDKRENLIRRIGLFFVLAPDLQQNLTLLPLICDKKVVSLPLI